MSPIFFDLPALTSEDAIAHATSPALGVPLDRIVGVEEVVTSPRFPLVFKAGVRVWRIYTKETEPGPLSQEYVVDVRLDSRATKDGRTHALDERRAKTPAEDAR